MTESIPLVSIMIPTFNRASMVGKAIESALAQTYPAIEVVVVDNASTDDIEKIVSVFHNPKLKLVKNPVNLGQYGNFNRCIELARGKYIHILHSDDFIDPTFTESCVNFFESHPRVALTFTATQILSDRETMSLVFADHSLVLPAPDGFRQLLLRRNFIPCPSVMIRKDAISTVGNFSLEYPYSSDYFQWLKVSKQFDIAFVQGPFLHYRQGDHSESFNLLFSNPLGYFDTLKIYVRLIENTDESTEPFRDAMNVALMRFLKDCIFAGLTRSNQDHRYSSHIFIGLAYTSLALFRPEGISDIMKKLIYFALIVFSAVVFIIPGGKYIIKKILHKSNTGY